MFIFKSVAFGYVVFIALLGEQEFEPLPMSVYGQYVLQFRLICEQQG
jgi:hypothetical protein